MSSNTNVRRVGRNVRLACISCKPDLAFDNILKPTDKAQNSNDSLQNLSLFFTDPASYPSTSQSPLRSPTPFTRLLSSAPQGTTFFTVTVSSPSPFSSPLRDSNGSVITGSGQTNINSDGTFSAFVTFLNMDLSNFQSGSNMYFLMPSFFSCSTVNFGGILQSVDPSTNITTNCLRASPPFPSTTVTTPVQIGQINTFLIFTNVVKTANSCPKVQMNFFSS